MSFIDNQERFMKLAEEAGLMDRIEKFAKQLAECAKTAGDPFNAKTMTPVEREAQMGANAGYKVKDQAEAFRQTQAASGAESRAASNTSGLNTRGQGVGGGQAAAQGINPNDY